MGDLIDARDRFDRRTRGATAQEDDIAAVVAVACDTRMSRESPERLNAQERILEYLGLGLPKHGPNEAV